MTSCPVPLQQIDALVERVVVAQLPTARGEFEAVGYRSLDDGSEHLVLVRGAVAGRDDTPVHVHPVCPFGDVFRSTACDCRARLEAALAAIEAVGHGVLIYLRDGEEACSGTDAGRSPVPNPRGSEIATEILTDLGVLSARLLPAA
jgi:3,4-dihydroxy 2-butanone 4-phosphate synthase / GTP cyclohydrolase II